MTSDDWLTAVSPSRYAQHLREQDGESRAEATVGRWRVTYEGPGGYTLHLQKWRGDWERIAWFQTRHDVNMCAVRVSAASDVKYGESIRAARRLAEQQWDEAEGRPEGKS